MSNGLTLPFSQTIPGANQVQFSIIVQSGGGGAISGESYGADQFGDTGTGVYGATDVGQAISGNATGSGGVAGAFLGAVQVNDTKNEDAFVSTSGSKDHAAVAAHNNNGGWAFWGASGSQGGTGIFARGATQAAQFVQTDSTSNEDGLVSTAVCQKNAAVAAHNNGGGLAFWGASDSPGGTGIFARGTTQAAQFVQTDNTSNEDGVVSTAACKKSAAVAAHNNGGGFAFWGSSDSDGGTGIYSRGAKLAALFDGAVQVNGNINMGGGDVIFSDCAEQFDVSANAVAEPGTVMVFTRDGELEPSSLAYDKRAAGVVSGAGDFRPGIVLGVTRESQRNRVAVALVGKVYCMVDATDVPIEVGDMLTTSPTVGHAMKASDRARAFGAVIGKALRPLATGTALIPILIALQ